MTTRSSTIDKRKQQLLDYIDSTPHCNPYRLFVEEFLKGAGESLLSKLFSTANELKSRLSSDGSFSAVQKGRQNGTDTSTSVAALDLPRVDQRKTRKRISHGSSAVGRFFASSDLVSYLFSFLELDTHHSLAQTRVCMMGLAGVALPVRMRSAAPWRKHMKLPTSITDAQLTRLCSYACLTSLDLSGCFEITDDALLPLQHLRIIRLDLNMWDKDNWELLREPDGQITDAGLEHLLHLPLEHLDLSGCEITDDGLVSLRHLPLKHLDLAHCRDITDDGLVHLKQFPLQHLNLSCCDSIDGDGLVHLKQLPLQHLDLNNCRSIEDDCWVHLKQLFQSLKHLDLGECCITDDSLVHLQQLPLQHLNLADCENITGGGLVHLLKQLPLLQHLNLSNCSDITDGELVHLKHLPLQHLNLMHCNITDDGLVHLKLLPLRHLNLEYCNTSDNNSGLSHLQSL
jgi:hypothetical protein